MSFESYISGVIVVVILCIVLRVMCAAMCRDRHDDQTTGVRRRVIRQIRVNPAETPATTVLAGDDDRQGNVFTIHDEANRESRFNDIFFIEPNSVEAARIRAQLEKDEKDLPSYEEVMRMTNLSSPTAAPATVAFGTPASAAGGAISVTASSSSVNTTETTLTIPQYTEVDLSATSRPVTPPPYSPPATPVILATANSLPTQHISSSNV